MQGKQLRLVAFAMLGLALILGVYGAGIGGQPQAPDVAAPAPAPTEAVWVFREAQPAGTVLAEHQLQRVMASERLADELADAKPYLGRVLAHPVSEGTRLSTSLLLPERPLLDALEAGQRAVAIQVDEVTAIGGHLRTGDRVDVLFYLKANKESGPDTTARRILQAVQVLAYGPELIGEQDQERQARSRSVVLAVPGASVPELVLAENTGRLRLAVVGHHEQSEFQAGAQATDGAASLRGLTGAPVATPPQALPVQRPPVELYLGEERVEVLADRGDA